MDADHRDPEAPSPPQTPLARVALVRRPAVTAVAKPVRVVVIEESVTRRKPPRAAVVGGSVWVLSQEHAVEEIPLGE